MLSPSPRLMESNDSKSDVPLSKIYSEKNKGFSVLSKFDGGCACAMWAAQKSKSETDFFDTLTIQNDQMSYVKHVLAPFYVFFILFGYWGGGRLPRGLGHNLLMQFSSLGNSRMVVPLPSSRCHTEGNRILFVLQLKGRGVRVASGGSSGGLYGGVLNTASSREGGAGVGSGLWALLPPPPPPPELQAPIGPRWERGGPSKHHSRTRHCPPVVPAFTSRRPSRGCRVPASKGAHVRGSSTPPVHMRRAGLGVGVGVRCHALVRRVRHRSGRAGEVVEGGPGPANVLHGLRPVGVLDRRSLRRGPPDRQRAGAVAGL